MKRASLQLSINAIVILVMAMVVLGLGLTFIRGLFEKGTDNLGRAIDNADLENPASADRPLTVDRSVTLKSGKDAKIRVGYYNAENACVLATPSYSKESTSSGTETSMTVQCQGSAGAASILLLSPKILIQGGTASGFELAVSDVTVGGAPAGDYVCGFQMFVETLTSCTATTGTAVASTPSGQFFLEITN